jgi:WD40 repeat protein
MFSPRRIVLVLSSALVASTLLLPPSPSIATPSVKADATAGTDGTVYAVVQSGDRIFVAGKFAWAGPVTGSGVPVDGASGQRVDTPARANGPVLATASDGSGGWYLGGAFTKVGKSNRGGLARITSSGALASWKGSVAGTVNAIAVSSGVVYIGGDFSAIGGVARQNLAAIDAGGSLLPWNPGANGPVRALAVSPDGSSIFAGGSFSGAGGQSRDHVASFTTGGSVTAWNPDADGDVQALAVSPSGSTVYVGGAFANVGGAGRNNVAAIDASSGTAVGGWAPNADGPIHALAVAGDGDVVAGGEFAHTAGDAQTNVARYEASDGSLVSWTDPAPDGAVRTVAVAGNTAYIGGDFMTIGGQARPRAAALDLTLGTATAWNPRADADVRALAVSGTKVFVGGDFSMLNGAPRNNVAAIDATTGEVDLGWNANANAKVRGLAVSPDGTTVYIGGTFFKVGGLARSKVAAVDATTGAVTPWMPSANGEVRAIAATSSRVYIGGYFTSVSSEQRRYLAAIDASSGAVDLGFAPAPDAGLRALEISPDGGELYAGGEFKQIGGAARPGVAELSPTTGAATSFAPEDGGLVLDVELSPDGNYLYCSTTSNRTHRYQPAVSDLPVWSMHSGGDVQAIGTTADTVYLGGHFTKFTTQNVERSRIGAIDAWTMDVLDWYPGMNSFYGVWAFDVQPDALLVGGDFTRTGGRDQPHFARFSGTP